MQAITLSPEAETAPAVAAACFALPVPPPAAPPTAPSVPAFEVEPAVLIGAAGTMEAEADALAEAARRLQLRLEALGACWGTDVVGARFGAAYEPVAATVLGNVGALATGLVRIGAALRASAQAYDLVDAAVVEQVGT